MRLQHDVATASVLHMNALRAVTGCAAPWLCDATHKCFKRPAVARGRVRVVPSGPLGRVGLEQHARPRGC